MRLPIRLPKQLYAYLMPFQRSGVVKKGVDWKKLVAMATSLERLQPNFTAIIYACSATDPENWAKVGRVHFEDIGLEGIVKTGSISAVRVIQGH